MNATRRDKLKALFDQAHPLPPEQQAAFLDEACRDDAALRENLASLLKTYNHAPDYFESLARAVLPEPLVYSVSPIPVMAARSRNVLIVCSSR